MFLQWLWFGMMISSVAYASFSGNGGGVLQAALQGTGEAIELSISLGAGYLFFCGLMEIVKALRIPALIERFIRPLLRLLMPEMRQASQAVTLNLSMNVLGLGNAATPAGLEAMRLLEQERTLNPRMRHDMYMLLILNATSIQLVPTTVLTLRTAAGSADPNAVLLPTLLCTAVSTAVGAALGLACRQWEEKHHAD